jgi:collagenase-like PrtC family protease
MMELVCPAGNLPSLKAAVDNGAVAVYMGFRVEGRSMLSSYVTGRSPNTYGACSPASAVSWKETATGLETRLNNVLIDRHPAGESAGYPTLCKGRFNVEGHDYYDIVVDVLRISPQSMHTEQIINNFHDRLHGITSADKAEQSIQQYLLSDECDGYWYGLAGMDNSNVSAERRGCA